MDRTRRRNQSQRVIADFFISKDCILKFLSILATVLVMILSNSGAVKATEVDPIYQIVNWFTVNPSYRCTIDDPRIYVHGLNYFYGQTELFLAETGFVIYNYELNDFEMLNGTMIFFANQSTGTYTIALLTDEGMLCEISNGWNFTPYSR